MFNDEFMPNLKEAIEEYIQENFEDKFINYKLNRDLNNDDIDKYKIDKLMIGLFNRWDKSYSYTHNFYNSFNYCWDPDMLLEMIIYCNEWLDNNGDQVIDWKQYRDTKYIINLTAYIYVKKHREQFVALINENKNKNDFVTPILK